jgi:phosphoribosylamine--glycine ligase
VRILIVGGGGREHALAWKCAQSPRVREVHVAPGNAGTAREPKTRNVARSAEDVPGLIDYARGARIDLAIIGPEAPLVAGIVDAFTAAGLRCYGPSRRAAELEGSKAYAKDFLARHGIPTARYGVFADVEAADAGIDTMAEPVVVKADGLAGGKGVVIAPTRSAARATARDMLRGGAFGAAGRRIVIEEFLAGEEASFIVMADGEHVLPLATSQDHKSRDDGDRGPNTGGMGAYSPAPVVTPAVHARVMREVIEPAVRGMRDDGRPYRGFLYAGLMIAADGAPKVLEFNCRFGDPETQPILMRLQTDLVDLVEAALDGRLDRAEPRWDARAALAVVLAARGYPGSVEKGAAIGGLDGAESADTKIFHAGTALEGGTIVVSGGRVLTVAALGASVADARARAYARVGRVDCPALFYRRDIGYRAITREQGPPRGIS